jgi:DNA-binding response OmpR family regulator
MFKFDNTQVSLMKNRNVEEYKQTDTYINFLRKKIDKYFSPKLIHTIVGMGYILKK